MYLAQYWKHDVNDSSRRKKINKLTEHNPTKNHYFIGKRIVYILKSKAQTEYLIRYTKIGDVLKWKYPNRKIK